jgi:hypothetical protein
MAAAAAVSKPTWNTPLFLLGARFWWDMWKAGVVAIGVMRGACGSPDPSELLRLWPPPMSERSTEDLDRWWWRDAASVGGCEAADGGRPCIVLRPAMEEDMAEVLLFFSV